MASLFANYNYPLKIAQIGLTGVLFQHVALVMSFLLPQKAFHPNWITLLNLLIAFSLPVHIFNGNQLFLATSLIIIIFLDNIDGTLARKWNLASKNGAFFDGFVDYTCYAIVLFCLSIVSKSVLPIVIICLYSIIINFKLHIKEIYTQKNTGNNTTPTVPNQSILKLSISFFTNHNDTIFTLALILAINSQLLIYWLYFEFLRRLFNLLLLFRHYWKNIK